MWNPPTNEQLKDIPNLYDTDGTPAAEKIIVAHFFIGGCDWYIVEFDGQDLFFGYAILNQDYQMAEWGYIPFSELKAISVPPGIEVDFDLHWKVRPASEVEDIQRAA